MLRCLRGQNAGLEAMRRLGVFILPALLFFLGQAVMTAAGPFWEYGNLDPAYVYLVNALAVAVGEQHMYFNHPGTPALWIGAAIIRLMHPLAGGDALLRTVIGDPEPYARLMAIVFSAMAAAALAWTGRVALDRFRSLALAMLAQAGPFFSASIMLSVGVVNVEPLTMAAAFWVAGLVLRHVANPARDLYRARQLVWAGIACGFGVAAKLTFLPVCLLPLLMVGLSARRLALFAAISFTALIGFTITGAQDYVGFLKLMVQRMAEPPVEGGRPGLAAEAAVLVGANAYLYGLLAGSVAVALLLMMRREIRRLPETGLILLIGLVNLGQIIVVYSQAQSRYMVPAWVIGGLAPALVLHLLIHQICDNRPAARWAATLLAVAVTGWAVLATANGVAVSREAFLKSRAMTMAATRIVQRDFGDCRLVTYYRSNDPFAALAFGQGFSGVLWVRLGHVLTEVYGRRYHFEISANQLRDWNGPVTWEELRGQAPCVVFRGTGWPPLEDGSLGFVFDDVCRLPGDERLYVSGRHCPGGER